MKLPVALLLLTACPLVQAAPIPADEHFVVETIADGFVDAMELAITPEGYVFVTERTGGLKLVRPSDGKVLDDRERIGVLLRGRQFLGT